MLRRIPLTLESGMIAFAILCLLGLPTRAQGLPSPDTQGTTDLGQPPHLEKPQTPEPQNEDLLRRLEALEKAAAERTSAPAQTPSTAGTFVQNLFNPDISVITDFALVGVNVDDHVAQSLTVPGFLDQSARDGKSRGFNFNYFEMAFNAAVDPYFDFFGVVTVAGDGIDVEEAYIDSRQLPFGLQLRAGKFLSAFGRLNGMHQHQWDFYDPPLVYEGLIGGEGLKNPGLRVSWTAPVDFLLQVNAEAYQGVVAGSPTFDATGYQLTAADGAILSAKAPFVPALYVGSIKSSFDVGNHVFLLGGSVMVGHSTQTNIEGSALDSAFTAPGTVLYDAELTYKYLLSSYRSITWQTEYLGRLSSGRLALASDGLTHPADKRQGGLYSQVIWRFDEPGQWRVGTRLDLLTQNSLTIGGVRQPLPKMLPRYTAMLEFSPSEFSRFRLQYAFDRSRYFAGAQKDVHEVLLQTNIAIGPHGAHSF